MLRSNAHLSKTRVYLHTQYAKQAVRKCSVFSLVLGDWQVNGGELPPHVLPFCAAGGAAAALLAIAAFFLQRATQRMADAPAVESAGRWRARRAAVVSAAEWAIPSGIGVAVGMYVAAEWTLPRVIGCLAEQVRRR